MTKEFNPETYQPIDYRYWTIGDEAREGVNIKRLNLLTPDELKVWDHAIPYQDMRDDPGQGEMVTYFAVKLLDYLPGDRNIVVPSAICHDTGWFGDDPQAFKKLVEKHSDNLQALEGEATRRPHQNRGCLKAGVVFERAKYPPEEYHNAIADIIGDHDTQKLPTTPEGEIVRSADFSWRVTYPCTEIYMPDFDVNKTLERMEETSINSPKSPFGDIAKQIARIELANTIYHKFPEDQAAEVLKPEYEKELGLVKRFYNY